MVECLVEPEVWIEFAREKVSKFPDSILPPGGGCCKGRQQRWNYDEEKKEMFWEYLL